MAMNTDCGGRYPQVAMLASLLSLMVMALLAPSTSGLAADPLAAMQVMLAERGKEAPVFSLPDPDGRQIGLRDFRGKVVLLTFFTTW